MGKIIEAKASLGQAKTDTESAPEENDLCFVIMPLDDTFDEVYHDGIFPAIQEVGLIPKRANDIYRPGDIVWDILNLTKEAKIVLADLTGRNPNVFYELGLAHAFEKPVILVTQSRDDVPFDLRQQRNIEYSMDDPDWVENLQVNISKSIEETLVSPLEAIHPAFLEVDEMSKEVISHSAAERMIKELVIAGNRNNTIIQELKKYGVSRSYTIEKIYDVKAESSDTFK